MLNRSAAVCFAVLFSGCAAIFGWNIHAPGTLSRAFVEHLEPVNARVALYFEPGVAEFISTNKGGWSADPQTYYVGEAFAPMLMEGFQTGFSEFVFLEVEPTPAVMKRYALPFVAVVRVKSFGNRVTLKGQALALVTETAVLDSGLRLLATFESTGVSDAEKVFAKKGGPELNLNAAVESNVRAAVQYLQDALLSGKLKAGA